MLERSIHSLTKRGETINWKVVKEHVPDSPVPVQDSRLIRTKPGVIETECKQPIANLFLKLMFSLFAAKVCFYLLYFVSYFFFEIVVKANVLKLILYDYYKQVILLNSAIVFHKHNCPASRSIKLFSETEFLIFLGLMIGAVCFAQEGISLWSDGRSFIDWETIEPSAHLFIHLFQVI